MRRLTVLVALAATAVMSGCGTDPVSAPDWFDGSFDEALASAQSRGTMLMLDFYSPS